jgi:hypothetical protein
VSKKRTRKDTPVPKPYLKKITLNNPFTKAVVDYFPTIPNSSLFLNISRQLAYYYLRQVDSTVWFHLFRESFAAEMAERGATEEKLMHWFDWDRVDTAHQYVKHGTKLTEEYSERVW